MVNNLYPVGTKLPTARELALELGVHRNTASKAFGLLADLGLVVSKPGRGTYVVAVADQNRQSGLAQQLRAGIDGVITAARRLGITEQELRDMLDRKVAEAYGQPHHRGVFIECNQADLDAGIDEIEASTQIRLDGILLEDLGGNPSQLLENYDVAFTNLIHVKEVSDLLGSAGNGQKVIGIYTQPDEDALVKIASIQPGSTVGIVVDSPEGAHRFTKQITTFNPVELKVVLSQDDLAIKELVNEVDAIVCSRSREEQVRSLGVDISVIALPFHMSSQSALRILDALVTKDEAPIHDPIPRSGHGHSNLSQHSARVVPRSTRETLS